MNGYSIFLRVFLFFSFFSISIISHHKKTLAQEVESGSINLCIYDDTENIGLLDPSDEKIEWNVTAEGLSSPIYRNNCYVWENLSPATYIIKEEIRDGWENSSGWIQMDGFYTTEVQVNANETAEVIVLNIEQKGTVLVCSFDEYEAPINGVKVYAALKESKKSLEVTSDGKKIYSSDLEKGNYITIASGTYEYDTSAKLIADAGYKQNTDDDPIYSLDYLPFTKSNILSTNNGSTDWGYYNPSHKYVFGFKNYSGKISFKIEDDNYDNNNGSITVDIYRGQTGITGTFSAGCALFTKLDFGIYEIGEIPRNGWEILTTPHNLTVNSPVPSEGPYQILNKYPPSGIKACTFIDTNGDGAKDRNEPYMSWETNLEIIDNSGLIKGEEVNNCYEWKNSESGKYRIYQDSKEDWTNTTNNADTEFDLYEGQIKTFLIGYKQNNPQVTIEKSNDFEEKNKTASHGDEIEYAIKIEVKNNSIEDLTIFDLPPYGFEVIEQSRSAKSSSRGQLVNGNDYELTAYNSPGAWRIKNVSKEEIITIKYKAKVPDNISSGVYSDNAYAIYTFNETKSYAISGKQGRIDSNFVGSKVKVSISNLYLNDKANVDVDEEIRYTNTYKPNGNNNSLPSTGTNIYILATIILIGLLSISNLFTYKLKYHLVLLFLFTIFAFAYLAKEKTYSESTILNARISELEKLSTGEFYIYYVALGSGSDDINIDCLIKGPKSNKFEIFESQKIQKTGNSGRCKVNKSMLVNSDENLTYKFQIKAKQDTYELASEITSTIYDSQNPETPKDFDVEKKNKCEYRIRFKTADDRQTTYVEIYRSKYTKFDVTEKSRVKTIQIKPNTEYDDFDTLSGKDCSSTNYYAIRSFDEAGQASEVVNQEYKVQKIDETSN